MDVSIVVPLFNEEESLPELCAWIDRVALSNQFSYEIILVDDGSYDTSWKVIESLAEANGNIKGIKFQRNYGKSAALNEGFRVVTGEVVITMDADLQDIPDEIPGLRKMILEEDFDLVSGWKKIRHDPASKTIPSKFFNWVTQKSTGIRLHDFNCGLKAYRREVVKSIDLYGEMHRYIPVIAKWNGFSRIGEKVVEHRPRKYGVTKFGLDRFLFGFLDLLSITFVSKYIKRPMHFFGTLGVLSFLLGTAIAVTLILEKINTLARGLRARNVTEQPLFFLALVAIVVGVQLFTAGFLGEMMVINTRRTHDYLIAERVGLPE